MAGNVWWRGMLCGQSHCGGSWWRVQGEKPLQLRLFCCFLLTTSFDIKQCTADSKEVIALSLLKAKCRSYERELSVVKEKQIDKKKRLTRFGQYVLDNFSDHESLNSILLSIQFDIGSSHNGQSQQRHRQGPRLTSDFHQQGGWGTWLAKILLRNWYHWDICSLSKLFCSSVDAGRPRRRGCWRVQLPAP